MLECNQCGKCCQKYADGGLSATAEEIGWWEASRPDIARYVMRGEIWIDPQTGNRLLSCPFLVEVTPQARVSPRERKQPPQRRYSCSIYQDRPEDCRQYPVSINDMVVDECEMLEVRDLRDTAVAQRKLDKLLIRS